MGLVEAHHSHVTEHHDRPDFASTRVCALLEARSHTSQTLIWLDPVYWNSRLGVKSL
jgi:hypothetical protein